jgi:hypothetical protein
MKQLMILFCCMAAQTLSAQGLHRSALFLGNSYTYYNTLPAMVASMATSTGDTLTHDSHTLGGYTLQNHTNNATSTNKIAAGGWDFVVLQEQSQLPSFSIGQVQTQVFPYARTLDSLINLHNPCGETVFYTTWGRENGDAANCPNFPPLCTYEGMDSMLQLRYGMMADDNAAIEAPVAAVWRYLRANTTLDLYDTDGSHPSLAGSYVAACTFYTVLFRKDPTLISYNAALSAADALTIRQAAKLIVFDDLSRWRVGNYDANADFSYTFTDAHSLDFTNTSTYADSFYWSFGDGDSSSLPNPTHVYPDTTAIFTVQLIAQRCGQSDTTTQQISLTASPVNISRQEPQMVSIAPNPAQNKVNIQHYFTQTVFLNVYNSVGQQVHFAKLCNQTEHIDLAHLAEGLYFFQISSAKAPIVTQKVKISR